MDWTSGIAQTLVETLKMVDAVPLSNDLAPEYALASYAPKASMLHSALELGMKALNDNFDPACCPSMKKCTKCKKYLIHDLAKVYSHITSPDVKNQLKAAFGDAVSFYGFPVRRAKWQHLADLKTYLAATGGKDLFEVYRYWALEKKDDLLSKEIPILFLSREMVRFIADLLINFRSGEGGPFPVSELVEQEIREALGRGRSESYIKRAQECPEEWQEDDNSLIAWLQGRPSLRLAMKEAVEHNFDALNSQANGVLRAVHADLAATTDYRVKPALTHALQTFRAKASDCQAVVPPALVKEYSNERGASVATPAGSPLGLIEERYDGLWWVKLFRNKSELDIANSQSDAVGLLVNAGTKLVSVSVNGDPAQLKRVFFPRGSFASRNASYEFWNPDHGISPGNLITLVIPDENHQDFVWKVDGEVNFVDTHTVKIAVENKMIVGAPVR